MPDSATTGTPSVLHGGARARRLLWRRGHVELWQEEAGDPRHGGARTAYFVGTPEGAVTPFRELHDACLHFWKITDHSSASTAAEQSGRQLELR